MQGVVDSSSTVSTKIIGTEVNDLRAYYFEWGLTNSNLLHRPRWIHLRSKPQKIQINLGANVDSEFYKTLNKQ